jgi:hypothetical protein
LGRGGLTHHTPIYIQRGWSVEKLDDFVRR